MGPTAASSRREVAQERQRDGTEGHRRRSKRRKIVGKKEAGDRSEYRKGKKGRNEKKRGIPVKKKKKDQSASMEKK